MCEAAEEDGTPRLLAWLDLGEASQVDPVRRDEHRRPVDAELFPRMKQTEAIELRNGHDRVVLRVQPTLGAPQLARFGSEPARFEEGAPATVLRTRSGVELEFQ